MIIVVLPSVGVTVSDIVEVIVIIVVLPSAVANAHYMHSIRSSKSILPTGNVLTVMVVGGPS